MTTGRARVSVPSSAWPSGSWRRIVSDSLGRRSYRSLVGVGSVLLKREANFVAQSHCTNRTILVAATAAAAAATTLVSVAGEEVRLESH